MSKNHINPNLRPEPTPVAGAEKKPDSAPKPSTPTSAASTEKDPLSLRLLVLTRSIAVGLLFLVPLWCWPGLAASLGFQKVLLALGGTVAIVVLLS